MIIAVLKFNPPSRETADLAARSLPSVKPGMVATAALLLVLACGAVEGALLLTMVVLATIRGLLC